MSARPAWRCISNHLPFALARFCSAENIENVVTDFRFTCGDDCGKAIPTSPANGLRASGVVVIDPYSELSL